MMEKIALGLYLCLIVAYIVTVVVVVRRINREEREAELKWRERRWR